MLKRALVVGHFTTLGDLEVLEKVVDLLRNRGVAVEVASYYPHISKAIEGALDPRLLVPEKYSHLFVCCGPFSSKVLTAAKFDFNQFAHCVRVGINLTMVAPLSEFNPFDVLLGRDCSEWALPDLSFLVTVTKRPVVGLCLVVGQTEYPQARRMHSHAAQMLQSIIERNQLASIRLDTEFPRHLNSSGWETAAEFESVCSRVDVMLTNRLHGTVISLKNGIPVIAIDPIVGGDKLSRQCNAVGWPEIFAVESATDAELDSALERCLRPAARDRANAIATAARAAWGRIDEQFDCALAAAAGGKRVDALKEEGRPLRRLLRSFTRRRADGA